MLAPELFILLGLLFLGVYLYQKFVSRRLSMHKAKRSLADRSSSNYPHRPAGRVDRQTRNKLTRLLGGNQKTIDRLIHQARLKNPGKAEQWYWEKVLYDLERDRWR